MAGPAQTCFLPPMPPAREERFCACFKSHLRELEAGAESGPWSQSPERTTRLSGLCRRATVVRATAMPEAVGQQVPQGGKEGGPN